MELLGDGPGDQEMFAASEPLTNPLVEGEGDPGCEATAFPTQAPTTEREAAGDEAETLATVATGETLQETALQPPGQDGFSAGEEKDAEELSGHVSGDVVASSGTLQGTAVQPPGRAGFTVREENGAEELSGHVPGNVVARSETLQDTAGQAPARAGFFAREENDAEELSGHVSGKDLGGWASMREDSKQAAPQGGLLDLKVKPWKAKGSPQSPKEEWTIPAHRLSPGPGNLPLTC
jgi:hypothetical protein